MMCPVRRLPAEAASVTPREPNAKNGEMDQATYEMRG